MKKILIDIDYIIRDNKPIIRKWYKVNSNETQIEYDEDFEPYFYASSDDLLNDKIKLENLNIKRNGDIIKIKRIEIVNKKLAGKPSDVLKIITYLPSHVPIFRDEVLRLRMKAWESDFIFTTRYAIDKDLKFYGELK